MDDAPRKYFPYLLSHETVVLAVLLKLIKVLFSTVFNELKEQRKDTAGC